MYPWAHTEMVVFGKGTYIGCLWRSFVAFQLSSPRSVIAMLFLEACLYSHAVISTESFPLNQFPSDPELP